jgi:hypothetical protein
VTARSAETRKVFRYRDNRRQYLCRARFQYRSVDEGGGLIERIGKAEHGTLIAPGKG